VQFAAGGISLEEAVRLTLAHDPVLKLVESDTDFAGGVAQQQSGQFDLTLRASVDYNRRIQELTQAQKDAEIKRREDLRNEIEELESGLGEAERVRNLLDPLRTSSPGDPIPEELARLSPVTAATIRALDELILSSVPPEQDQFIAIRNDFLNQTFAVADAELTRTQALLIQDRTTLENIGAAPEDELFVDAAMNVHLAKLFRSGVVFSPFVDGTFQKVAFDGKPQSATFGGKGLTDLFQFQVGVDVLLPLARGRGATAVAAPERAALIEYDASLLTLEHERAVSVLNTVGAYWQLRAAQEFADIAAQSVEFQEQLVELTQGLIDTQLLAGADISRVRAAEARARAPFEDARNNVKYARVALAIAMGVAATEDDATLPLAGDPFPRAPDMAVFERTGLVDHALDSRQDLVAATLQEEAGRTLEEAARQNRKPVLDLSLRTWFTAGDDTFGKAADRWVGPSAGVSLQFEKPLGNNTLEGQFAQAQAAARQRQIAQLDLDRQIRLGVIQATETLRESASRVQQALAAVNFYQNTIDAELERFRQQLGSTTLIDVVVTEQQQIDALLALVSARLDLAQRIVRLRFETGTMVTGGAVRAEDLVTVPTGGGGRP
jgi:outer membrane protein TolC